MQHVHTTLATYEINSGLFQNIEKLKNLGVGAKNEIVKEAKHKIHEVSTNLKLSKESVIKAFEEPRMMNVLEACGYSFATLYGAMSGAANVASHGVMHTLIHVAEHEGLHMMGHKAAHHQRTKKVDAVLSKYPSLKKLAGPALAGVLLYGYMHCPTPKSLEAWDMSDIKRAFSGDFTVGELLTSGNMVSLTASLATGNVMSLSKIAANSTDMVLALTCNAIIHSSNPKLKAIGEKLKGSIDKFKAKGNALDDIASSKGFKPSEDTPKTGKPAEDGKPAGGDGAEKKQSPAKEAPEKKGNPSWFDAMSEDRQKQYLEDHPNSIYQPASVRASIGDMTGLATRRDPSRIGEEFMDVPLQAYPGMETTNVGSGVLFCARDTGRMLWVRRAGDSDAAGTWCTGGGGVEIGETISDACRREVREELGYDEPYDLIPMHKDQHPDSDFVFHNHFAFVPREFVPVLNDEHTAFKWSDSIPDNCHPGLLRALDAYKGA